MKGKEPKKSTTLKFYPHLLILLYTEHKKCFFTNEYDFYLLTVSVTLKRNQRQELLPEQKPHFSHLQIQEINALIRTIKSPSFFFFPLVPVSVSKGGRISRFPHGWGMSTCSAVTEGSGRHPPMRDGRCPFLAVFGGFTAASRKEERERLALAYSVELPG